MQRKFKVPWLVVTSDHGHRPGGESGDPGCLSA